MSKANTVLKQKVAYMNVNVILTFDTYTKNGSQEFFDLRIPVSKNETDAVSFLNNKLFKRIVQKCAQLGRRSDELFKISTASDWDLFERTTNLPSLSSLGHNCKWHFGKGLNNLTDWEKELMLKYGFGTYADMSYLNELDHNVLAEIINKKIMAALENF